MKTFIYSLELALSNKAFESDNIISRTRDIQWESWGFIRLFNFI